MIGCDCPRGRGLGGRQVGDDPRRTLKFLMSAAAVLARAASCTQLLPPRKDPTGPESPGVKCQQTTLGLGQSHGSPTIAASK